VNTTRFSESILIVGPSWVGDMLMAQSLFKALKQDNATCHIDVLASEWSEGLLKRMPEVRHVIVHDFAHGQFAWKERQELGISLRKHDYDRAIVLPNSWKSALVPYWANIPQRTGFTGELRYGLLTDRRDLDKLLLPKTVDRFVALGLDKSDERIGSFLPAPQLSPKPVLPEMLARLGIEYQADRPVLALCTGAEYGPSKRWPLEYFAEVAQQKISEGWQVWLFGSHKDTEINQRVNTLTGHQCVDLTGCTQLEEAVDLLALTQAVVANDSGLMHVASALDRPLVAVYGSSNPYMTPPLRKNACTDIVYQGLKCSPCFKRTCKYKHMDCLRTITPEQVLHLLEKYN